MRRRWQREAQRIGVLLLCMALPGWAATQDSPALPRLSDTERRAKKTIDEMLSRYRALTSLEQKSVHTMSWSGTEGSGRKVMPVQFAYERPNRFLYQVENDREGVVLHSDGRELTVYSVSLKFYMVKPAGKSMSRMRSTLGQWGTTYLDALSFLMGDDPYRDLQGYRWVMNAKLQGRPVEVVELLGTPKELGLPNAVTRLYIGREDRLLYKSVTNSGRLIPPSRPTPGAQPGMMNFVMTKTHTPARVDQALPKAVFDYRVPSGATRVKDL